MAKVRDACARPFLGILAMQSIAPPTHDSVLVVGGELIRQKQRKGNYTIGTEFQEKIQQYDKK